MQISANSIPDNFISKWQETADLLANITNIPAALIMKANENEMEVFVTSNSKKNPYKQGDKEKMHGLYCETVVKSKNMLLIPNALKDKDWDRNPDIDLGMISYLGFPILYPNGDTFGTICILDNKENYFSETTIRLIKQFKNVVELDIAILISLNIDNEKHDINVIQELFNKNIELEKAKEQIINNEKKISFANEEYQSINEELRQSNQEIFIAKNIAEENEKQFKLLVENAPEPIFIQSESKFTYVNKATLELYGAKSEKELLDTPILDRIPNEYKQLVVERISLLNEKNTAVKNIEYKHLRLDNTIIDVEVSAVPIKYKQKTSALVFVKDITERKRLEAEKNETINLINNLANEVPGVIYQYQLFPDGSSCFPYSSKGMQEIYEVSSEEVKKDASKVFSRIYPDDLEYIKTTILESAKNQTDYKSEFRVILPKQGLRWRHCNAHPELLADGSTLWHGIITDITEQKKIEQEIKESKLEFENFFNCALDLLSVANQKGKFIRLNKEWASILGYRLDELEGHSVLEFTHPDDYKQTENAIEELRNKRTIYNFTNRIRCKNNEYKWLEWRALPYENKIYAAARDISDRINYEDSIKHSQELMKYIIEHNWSGVAVHDKDLKYIYVSAGYYYDYDIELTNIIGKHHYEVMPNLPPHLKDIHQRVLNGEVLRSDEEMFYKKDGTQQWSRWECRPWYEFDGSIGGFILYYEIITNRKKMELELLYSKEKAEESDRLKSAFLQNMSHEIRTPMNGIIGFSELLKTPGLSDEKRNYFSDVIIRSSQQLLNIVNDIITISSIETKQELLNNTEENINIITNEVLQTFTSEASKSNIKLNLTNGLANSDALIIIDKNKINQILINLLSNAIKFTNSGGSIEFGYTIKNNLIEFFVNDTGIGIEKCYHEKIFERFWQVNMTKERVYGGNGLGLSICKGLVELMGGKINLKSELGKGTSFQFSIPYCSCKKTDEISLNKTAKKNIPTILVAEDEEINFFLIKEILQQQNINIIHAKNGQEAVDICKEVEKIDIVLMDIKMPILDGYQATIIIKGLRPHLPIIAQTAYALVSEIIQFKDVFDDYITKPIEKDSLLEKINKLIVVNEISL
jgi:PAS domain S-box-containing protein